MVDVLIKIKLKDSSMLILEPILIKRFIEDWVTEIITNNQIIKSSISDFIIEVKL